MTEELDFLNDDTKAKNQASKQGISLGSIVLIVGLLAFMGVIALQLTRQNQTQPTPGQVAPNFTMTTFDGETITLEDWRGQVVVMNFWGSWCGPCRFEAPDLQAIHEDYVDRGVVMFGVNWLDIEDNAFDFMDEFGITYRNAPDISEKVAEDYSIDGAPETFIIGPDGVVTHAFLGPVDYDDLATSIESVLAGAGE